jgi:cytoskeletal protein CcmA (bactofilin family)
MTLLVLTLRSNTAVDVQGSHVAESRPASGVTQHSLRGLLSDVVEECQPEGLSASTLGASSGAGASSTHNYAEDVKLRSSASLIDTLLMFNKAVVAIDGNITLRGNSRVTSSASEGNIHANGTICLRGNARVDGSASATGTIHQKCSATITGVVTGSAPQLNLSTDDISDYISQCSQEADQGTFWDGDCEINGSGPHFLGPMYIAGDLVVSGSACVELCGTIYVAGDIGIGGSARILGTGTIVAEGDVVVAGNSRSAVGQDMLTIISACGDIEVAGNGWISAVLCAPQGSATLSGNASVCGAVVAGSICAGGNSQVLYPSAIPG